MELSWQYLRYVMMMNDTDVYAEGGNYRVIVDSDGVAHFRVWRRPGVANDSGAMYARELVEVIERLLSEPWSRVRGVLLDLVDAATTWGPGTRATISDIVGRIEQAGRWLAVVTAPDAVQLMTVASVLKKSAPRGGRAFGSLSSGQMWAGQRKRMAG